MSGGGADASHDFRTSGVMVTVKEPTPLAPTPSLTMMFMVFSKISLTSFGGGLSGWLMRDLVQTRRWLSDTEFLTGLSIAQVIPGVNVVNMSIWIGFRLRGTAGAVVCACGTVAPALVASLLLLEIYTRIEHYSLVNAVMPGLAAAALGLSMQTGLRSVWRVARSAVPVMVFAVTFLAIFWFRIPLIRVFVVIAPISMVFTYFRLRRVR